MSNERPCHELRLGKCKAAIWRNSTEQGPRYNVTFARIYRQEDRWESTSSFGRDDLPLIAKLADQAHTWIYQQQATEREQPASSEAPPVDRRTPRRSTRGTATASR